MMSQFLAGTGYSVRSASDGDEAVRLVGDNPNLMVVLLDLDMPGTSGMETLKEIRRVHPSVQVIMVTRTIDREIAQQALMLGAFDYITKPFNLHALEDVIVAGISRAELRRQLWWRRVIS